MSEVTEPIENENNRQIVARLAHMCCTLVHDKGGLLPLKPEQKVLCIEPYYPLLQAQGNDYWWHSDMLQEYMQPYTHHNNIASKEVINGGTEEDAEEIVCMSENFDVIVVVCQKFRNSASSDHIARKLIEAGRKVIVLGCNPYEISLPLDAATVIVTYGMVSPILKNAADVLYGKAKSHGDWPLKNYELPV